MRSLTLFLVGLVVLVVFAITTGHAHAQTQVPQGGTGNTSFPAGSILVGAGTAKLTSTSSPTVGIVVSTSTTATSSFPRISLTTAINFLGDYITNVTTWFTSKADTWLATKSTTNLTEGTNLYYTPTRDIRFSTTSADYYTARGLSFSTTSTDYWKTQNNFFSTTSDSYFSSLGLSFSTTSASYFLSQNQGSSFSTTSALYFASLGLAHSTTSANYSSNIWAHGSTTLPKTYTANTFALTQTFTLAPVLSSLTGVLIGNGASAVSAGVDGTNFTLTDALTCSAGQFFSAVTAAGVSTCGLPASFSTTSASYFSSLGLAFSTTSSNYHASVGLSFSTTSANFFSSVGLGFSSTSAAYYLAINPPAGSFSTTSANAWSAVGLGFSTTSSDYWGSTKAYLTGNQTITLSGDVSGSGSTAITTTIGSNKVTVGMLATAAANTVLGNPTGATGNVQAFATSSLFNLAAPNTNGILSSTDWSSFNSRLSSSTVLQIGNGQFFSTTSASVFSGVGLAFSTTSSNYWETQQTARTADDLTNNSIEDLNDVTTITENLGDIFYWNGSSWADIATSSLGISTTNVVEGSNLFYTDARVATYLAANPPAGAFSTTSALYFSSVGLGFSTTSASYFSSLGLAFSTTSDAYFSSVGRAHSTTSVAYQLTQTPVFIGGFISSASSSFTTLNGVTASTTNLTVSGTRSALGLFSSAGVLSAYAGSSNPCTSQFPTTISAIGALGGCGSVTDAFFSGQLTVSHGGTGLTTATGNGILYGLGTNAFGITASSASSILVTNSSGVPSLSTTLPAFTLGGAITAGANNISGIGLASTSNLTISTIQSSVLKTSSTGIVVALSATTCTNQFVRSMSAAYVATCSTVGPSDMDLTTTYAWTGQHTWTGKIGLGTASPSALQGVTIATTTIGSGSQFAWAISSSTVNNAIINVSFETGNEQRYLLQQNTSIVLNSTSSYPRDGAKYILDFCQDNTGSRTLTFITPQFLVWLTPEGTTTIRSTPNTLSSIGMTYDGRIGRYLVRATSTAADVRACLP